MNTSSNIKPATDHLNGEITWTSKGFALLVALNCLSFDWGRAVAYTMGQEELAMMGANSRLIW